MANFARRISDVARRMPGRGAVERIRANGDLETTTYGALEESAGQTAAWLVQEAVGPGDRVAILADNDAAWIAAYLGALRIGAVAVPLDTAYKAAQVGIIIADC